MKNIPRKLARTLKTGINTIVLNKLPGDVPAMVTENIDQTYTIALNGSYAHNQLQKAFLHELKHIQNKHFELTADEAEKQVRSLNPKQLSAKAKRERFYYFLYEARELAERIKALEEARKRRIENEKALKEFREYERKLKAQQRRIEARQRRNTYRDREADYYPDGAYEDMRRRGWI